jgi:hypothetical protein
MDERFSEIEAIAEQLAAVGLIAIHVADDGSVSYSLTRKGAEVGRSLPLGGDAGAILDALITDGRDPRKDDR